MFLKTQWKNCMLWSLFLNIFFLVIGNVCYKWLILGVLIMVTSIFFVLSVAKFSMLFKKLYKLFFSNCEVKDSNRFFASMPLHVPRTTNISRTWARIRNADFRASSQTYWIRIYVLTKWFVGNIQVWEEMLLHANVLFLAKSFKS